MTFYLRFPWCVVVVAPAVLVGVAGVAGAGDGAAATAPTTVPTLVAKDSRSMNAALRKAKAGDRIVLAAGARLNALKVARPGVTVDGRGARIRGKAQVRGAGAAIENLTIGGTVSVTGDGASIADCRIDPSRRTKRALQVRGAKLATVRDVTIARGGIDASAADGLLLAGTTVEVPGADVSITGRGVEISGNDFATATVGVAGAGALVASNVAAVIDVLGDRAEIRGNTLEAGRITYVGALGEIDGNFAQSIATSASDRVEVRGNQVSGGGIDVEGNAPVVAGNTLWSAVVADETGGIRIDGDFAVVDSNDLGVSGDGIAVDGLAPMIVGNKVVAVGSGGGNPHDGSAAIRVEGGDVRPVISGNEIVQMNVIAILVRCDNATVDGNVIRGQAPLDSIVVDGDGALVSGNDILHEGTQPGRGSGIVVTGDWNSLVANVVELAFGDGIAVASGVHNVITDCDVTTAGRCGIIVDADATETLLSGCDVWLCTLGVGVSGAETTVSGCTLQRNECGDLVTSIPVTVENTVADVVREVPVVAGTTRPVDNLLMFGD